jgi:DNA (cytosine-5)-methyltransferase 1
MGYHRAGFDVVGVDIEPQPSFPFPFVQGDAIAALRGELDGIDLDSFDAIHASPPCQYYTRLRSLPWLRDREYWRSIPPVMELLARQSLPWIVENVESAAAKADLGSTFGLCGQMFGLHFPDGRPLYRHRLFSSSFFMLAPGHPKHQGVIVPGPLLKNRGRLNNGYVIGGHQTVDGGGPMQIDWMKPKEVAQAIPPAYTEWLGAELIKACDTQPVTATV